MSIKNTEYRLNTALLIAKMRNARVLFVFNKYEDVVKATDTLRLVAKELDFTLDNRTKEYKHCNGGVLSLRVCSGIDYAMSFGGLQISHLFYDEQLDYHAIQYLKSKVKSASQFDKMYPVGTYHIYGAEVIIDY